jgi:hypothetical protein
LFPGGLEEGAAVTRMRRGRYPVGTCEGEGPRGRLAGPGTSAPTFRGRRGAERQRRRTWPAPRPGLGGFADESDAKTHAGTTAGDGQAPAKASFIAAADAICAERNAKVNEALGAVMAGGEPEPAAVQAALRQALDASERQIRDLRALPVPSGDEQAIDALLDESGQVAASLRARIATLQGAMEVVEASDPFAAVNEKAAAYGFVDCSDPGGDRGLDTQAHGVP